MHSFSWAARVLLLVSAGFGARHGNLRWNCAGGNVQTGKSLPSMMGAFKYWEFTAGSVDRIFFMLIIAY